VRACIVGRMRGVDLQQYDALKYRRTFEDHVDGLKFEHELIDRKITWLLTSQTVLFAALGLSLGNPVLDLVRVMAGVGIASCAIIGVGLVGNVVAKWLVHRDYRDFLKTFEGSGTSFTELWPRPWGVRGRKSRVEFGVRSTTTFLGILADLAIPLAFAVAWIYIFSNAASIVSSARPLG
jgi:hypothetical protein